MRAGIELAGLRGRCSASFLATVAGRSAFLTAGHCFEGGESVVHSATVIGSVGSSVVALDTDGAYVGLGRHLAKEAWVVGSTRNDVPVLIETTPLGERVGDSVCHSGITTARSAARCATSAMSRSARRMGPGASH